MNKNGNLFANQGVIGVFALKDIIVDDYELVRHSELFRKYGINNCEDLQRLFDEGVKEFQVNSIKVYLDTVNWTVNRLNMGNGVLTVSGNVKEIPRFETYEKTDIDPKLLEAIDSNTKANVLPVNKPAVRTEQVWFRRHLSSHSITNLKHNMTNLTKYGKLVITKTINGRMNEFYRLYALINFYDEHIVRLINEASLMGDKVDTNILTSYYNEKNQIIWANRVAIFENLFAMGGKYVFGDLTPRQMGIIMKSATTGYSDVLASQMAEVIATWSTYNELQENGENPKVLKRLLK